MIVDDSDTKSVYPKTDSQRGKKRNVVTSRTSEEAQKRKKYESILENIKIRHFQILQKYERENLAHAMQCKTYSTGEAVFRVGDMADGIYFVETGTLAVLVQIEGVGEKGL